MEPKKTCFVVMGFGKKTDFETNRVLDLDKSYRNIIKPAVEAAGLICIRADEIVHSGLIDVPMYEQLLHADVVVADLSTSNKNAFYELGIRHALRPFSTVIIAEDGIKTFPFDINHVAVRQYHHMGEDIGFDEVMRFRSMLTDTIKTLVAKNPDERRDSPVYTFLNGLKPPELAARVQAAIQEAVAGPSPLPAPTAAHDVQTHSALMDQVDEAQKNNDWIMAKSLLSAMRRMAKDAATRQRAGATVDTMIETKEDPYLIQRLALATYKSESPDERRALLEAHQLISMLAPHSSNDMETLGLWASIHKKLWMLDGKEEYLEEALKATERGFVIASDRYNGINYAFLLDARATTASDPDEAAADRIVARRVRKKVLELCDRWLDECPPPNQADACPEVMEEYVQRRYWVLATKGEALVGLGNEAAAGPVFDEAFASAPQQWMKDSAQEQLAELRELLARR